MDRHRSHGVSAEPGTTPDHLAVIRPPTATRLTARRRLRVDRRSPSCSEAWGEGRSVAALSAGGGSVESKPSDISRGDWNPGRRSDPFQPREPVPNGARQCARCSGARDAFHPGRPRDRSFELSCGALPRWPARAAAARVHRCSRTSTRPLAHPLSRVSWRPRAPLWLLQIDVSTSTTVDRSSTPAAESAAGATARFDRVTPIEGNHRMGSRSGVEEQPVLDAPRGDCSPRRLRPNLDPLGRLLSRPSLSCPVRSDAGRKRGRHRNARLQGSRATGPCVVELPRRSQTTTCPRRLPSQGRSRTNEGCRRASKLDGREADAFFTAEVTAREDARSAPGSSVDRSRRPANQPVVDRPQRPL